MLKNGAKNHPSLDKKNTNDKLLNSQAKRFFNLTQLQKADEGLATQSTKNPVKTGTVKLRKILDYSS